MKKLLLLSLLIGVVGLPTWADSPSVELTGIINLPGYKCALLEGYEPGADRRLGATFTLQEGQKQDWLEVIAIHPDTGSVEFKLNGKETNVGFTVSHPGGAPDARPSAAYAAIQLQHAELNHVLRLYGELSKHTVLRPDLTAGPFVLRAAATNDAQAVAAFEKAFSEQGLKTIPDGVKFVMVVPADKVSMANPRSSRIKSPADLASRESRPVIIPPGEINLPGIPIRVAVPIYAELLGGRHIDHATSFSDFPGEIYLVTQSPITKEEAIYAFDTLFSWQHIKVLPVGNDLLKVVRIPDE